MTSTPRPIRVEDDKWIEMQQMATNLGFISDRSGEPSVAEYLRNLHDAAVEAYEQGRLIRRNPLEFKGNAQIGRQSAASKADDLEYGALDE
jgi:hypothetical protein